MCLVFFFWGGGGGGGAGGCTEFCYEILFHSLFNLSDCWFLESFVISGIITTPAVFILSPVVILNPIEEEKGGGVPVNHDG